jgi:YbbR domain-containing protein
VKRLGRLLFHNWPLKLAAVALATMLYAGLVVSQSVQELPSSIAVVPTLPKDAVLGAGLPNVTRISYVTLGDASARASADTFRATIDLSGVDPNAGTVYVPIKVESRDPRFAVVNWEPPGLNVALDPLKSKKVPVRVSEGTPPAGLEVRPAVISPEMVTVRGAASVIDRVVEARADVVIEPNGLEIDRDIDLVPVDVQNNRLTPVQVTPASAHVTIAVFTDRETRQLPVTPFVTGTPATGYEVASVTVSPLLVTVEGNADQLVGLASADTEPISISGATQDVTKDAALALPQGVLPVGRSTVQVTITLRPQAGTRTYDAAIVLAGGQAGLDYRVSTTHALATVGGPIADLERLDGATFTLLAPVGGLGPGTHEVTLAANLSIGLTLVAVNPRTVTVMVTVASPATPSASP